MAHKFCFEALDRSLRDVIKVKSSSDKIFGGKVMLFGGEGMMNYLLVLN